MPFVSLDGIKPFISDGLYNALAKNDMFTAIENEVAIFINKTFSLEIPASIDLAPYYIKRPAAMIIQKFARNKLQSLSNSDSDSFESIVEKEYEWAIDYLTKQTTNDIDSTIGTITGVDEW